MPRNESNTASPLAEAAVEYGTTRGWRILPVATVDGEGVCRCHLRANCKDPGKHPLIKSWQKEASTNAGMIREWYRKWPLANVAVATGAESGIVVLDVDSKSGGPNSLADLQQRFGDLPVTLTNLTGGGGFHLIFRHPGGDVPNSAGTLGAGLDIRGDGGYIIIPPSLHKSGQRYIWRDAAALIQECPVWVLTTRQDGAKKTGPEKIGEGGRNQFLTGVAGELRRLGADQDEIERKLKELNVEVCIPPLGDDEVTLIASGIMRYEAATTQRYNDTGNARRIVAKHGRDIRHVATRSSFLIWDGKRWVKDETQQAGRLAQDICRDMFFQAAIMADEKDKKALKAWASTSESESKLNAMLGVLETQPEIALRSDAFDANGWLLNCANGVLDLRTGTLRPHRREDYITKLCPVAYNDAASSSLWDEFLQRTTNGDTELQRFLQRAAGYSLTGDIAEDVLFFVHGPGATGKSTFINALKAILSDYSITTSFETFLAKKYGGGASNDIADLAGARLVLSVEVEDGRKLAEATIKQMTGGDTVRARHLYQSNFEFKPQFKLWLVANHKPKVSDDDDAIWRRMLRVPFENVVPLAERDATVRARLLDPAISGEAILAWAVQGCMDWQEKGLNPPEIVKQRTEEYREEMDPLKDFIEERCVIHQDAWVPKMQLWAAYEVHAKANGIKWPLTRRQLTERVKQLDTVAEDRKGDDRTPIWKGIGVATDSRVANERSF